jgi:serine protease
MKGPLFFFVTLALTLLSFYACTSTSSSPPVPGDSGAITVSNESEASFSLSWTRATDDTTAREDLEYRVYCATVFSIDSADAVEANATPVGGWERDLTEKYITALDEETQHFYTVLVRDADENSAAYGMISDTSVSGHLIIGTVQATGSGTILAGDFPFSNLNLPDETHSGHVPRKTSKAGSSEPEFIPGEIIVRYKPGIELSMVQGLAFSGGFSQVRTSRTVETGARTLLRLTGAERTSLTDEALADRTLREIERLNALPYVEYAQPNYIYKPLAIPGDQYYHFQWHYPLMKWDLIWDDPSISNLQEVTVAVIDTGIARSDGTKWGHNHVDFGGSGVSPFVDEYDFISRISMSLDEDGRDDDASDPGDNPDWSIASFHGTHVAGTIGAYTGNGEDTSKIGVAGIAGRSSANAGVRIMPLRVLGFGGGATDDIVEAIRYAARLDNLSGRLPSTQADIINMSFGGTSLDPDLQEAVDEAYAKDIVIIAAAGNNGTGAPLYPAAFSNVISVSAVDIGAEISPYSSYGTTIDVAAPGGSFSFDLNFDSYMDGILSTYTERIGESSYRMDLYAFQQGTSMAAAHVSGLAALVKATNTDLTADSIRSRIENTAIDLGQPGRDDLYGNGLVNAHAAVTNGSGDIPLLFPFPKKVILQGENPTSTFMLKNIGGGAPISINSILKSDPDASAWLNVDHETLPASTDLEVTLNANTQFYPWIMDGTTHHEMLTIQSTAGTEYVYALYNSTGFTDTVPENIGPVYVVAINAETLNIDYFDLTDYDKEYRYRISPITTGTYIIGASTDHNSDFILFEPEDYYGLYIDPDQIQPVDVHAGGRVTDIDFSMLNPPTYP